METAAVPIKNKLTGMIVATSLGVLVVACVVLFLYDRHSHREMMPRGLTTAARIVAANSAQGLVRDDPKRVAEVLATTKSEPEVVAAALYSDTGRLAATFPSSAPSTDFPAAPGVDGVTNESEGISVFEPVMNGERRVGTLYLKGRPMSASYMSLSTYGVMLLGIAACSGLLALVLSNFLRRRISEPLATLAATARAVSAEKDYSRRANKVSGDEFGQLTDAFNLMLDEIQLGNAALRAGEERFRTLADNMAQLAWMAEPDGSVTWYNKRWYDHTGRGPLRPMEGQTDLIESEHAARVAAKFRRCVEAGDVWQDTFPLRGRDGSYRWFLGHALPIRGAHDKVVRWFGTNTDITELRETQHELRRTRDEAIAASHAKDEFLATLSHELRTPLNPVLLLVSDAQRTAELPPDVREDFETIRKHVELEARLIDDMLDLTSITRGKVVLDLRPLNLHNVVRDALKTVDADRKVKRIAMVVELDPREPVVMGDAVRLQQVLWNVIKNAIKFSAPGGTVTVRSRVVEADGTWIIDVIDRGIGMLPAEIERAFDAFVQGDHAVGGGSHRFGGLGLGLAISRKLMELHDGKIGATSAGMGQGSAFTISIPTLSAERGSDSPFNAARKASVHPFGKSVRQLRILLVEDHSPTRLALERLLIRRGHCVASAGCLADARTLARSNRYDVLVSDIGLPDGTGYELMVELRDASGMLGLALTGYGTAGDIALAKEAGFLAHLTKPVRTELLEDGLNLAITTMASDDR